MSLATIMHLVGNAELISCRFGLASN